MLKQFLLPLVFLSLSTAAHAETTATVYVRGVACVFCNSFLEAKLGHIPGVVSLQTNLKKSNFVLTLDPKQAFDYGATKQAVIDSGYGFESIDLTVTGAKILDDGLVQDPGSGQKFQIVDSNNPVSKEEWESIKETSRIEGKALPDDPLKIDIEMP